MPKTLRALAALSIVPAAWLAPALLPAQAATNGRLAGCIGAAGTMRPADAGSTCRNGEKPVRWNTQGPAGAPGASLTMSRLAPGVYQLDVTGLGNTRTTVGRC